MNDEKHEAKPINDVDRVIYDYLDDMLHDSAAGGNVEHVPDKGESIARSVANFDIAKQKAPAAPQAPIPIIKTPAVTRAALPYQVAKRATLLSESLLRLPVEAQAKPEADIKPVAEMKSGSEIDAAATIEPAPIIAPEPEPDLESKWCDNGRPHWAQSRFECLIFNVGGLKLAVPLVTLGSIHQIDRKFNALPGQFDWFLGILQTANSGNIKVLDTGLCVMPERYNPASRSDLAYVITIHGYAWGLACNSVEKSITLEPNQVKWRTQRGKRPWLAGTVVDYMCSLVDTDGFQEIINNAEQAQ